MCITEEIELLKICEEKKSVTFWGGYISLTCEGEQVYGETLPRYNCRTIQEGSSCIIRT